jgi:hypothetical protein
MSLGLEKESSPSTVAVNTGVLYYDSTTGLWGWQDEYGAVWNTGVQRKYLASDLTGTAETSATDVTGIAFPLLADTAYGFEFCLIYRASGTGTGVLVGLSYPASPTVTPVAAVDIYGVASNGVSSCYHGTINGQSATVASAATVSASYSFPAHLRGIIVNGANAGTLQLQYAAGTGLGGATLTPKAGTYGRLWRM